MGRERERFGNQMTSFLLLLKKKATFGWEQSGKSSLMRVLHVKRGCTRELRVCLLLVRNLYDSVSITSEEAREDEGVIRRDGVRKGKRKKKRIGL